MYNNSNTKYIPIPQNWIADYSNLGIDISSVKQDHLLWWDREILALFALHGLYFFRRLNIWYVDWNTIAKKWDRNDLFIKGPLNYWDKAIFKILSLTQNKNHNRFIFWLDRFLNKIFR